LHPCWRGGNVLKNRKEKKQQQREKCRRRNTTPARERKKKVCFFLQKKRVDKKRRRPPPRPKRKEKTRLREKIFLYQQKEKDLPPYLCKRNVYTHGGSRVQPSRKERLSLRQIQFSPTIHLAQRGKKRTAQLLEEKKTLSIKSTTRRAQGLVKRGQSWATH